MPHKFSTYFLQFLHDRSTSYSAAVSQLPVEVEGGWEPGPGMMSDNDGSGGESRGTVQLAELRVLPVRYYIMSYKVRCQKEKGCGWFRDGA